MASGIRSALARSSCIYDAEAAAPTVRRRVARAAPTGGGRVRRYSGRYMYHCHILEHEDRDMMRPFVTMPAELMRFMA